MDKQPEKTYTEVDVKSIIRRALQSQKNDECTQEELEEIAAESGISIWRLQQAVDEETAARKIGIRKRRRSLTFSVIGVAVAGVAMLAFLLLSSLASAKFPGQENGAPTVPRQYEYIP